MILAFSRVIINSMADLGTLITIADKVFQLLQSPVLVDMKNWKSNLENLNKSVSFIKNLLLDADAKPELSHGEQAWVEELKEILYEADDLFDEVITIAKMKELNDGAKFYEKVLDKGHRMNKKKLISLWMAQEYIGDSEDNFLILLKRCFFQDVEKDELGDVVSFTMHDLMHDVALEVAGDEIDVVNSPPNNLSKKIRHFFLSGENWTRSSFKERSIRTCYMNTSFHPDVVKSLVVNWRCLRSLRLYVPDAKDLPESIGELLHLRYLDLSDNRRLAALPNSITELYNLQSLIMSHCSSLREWPKHFCKLINLRLLDISSCSWLTCMPLGIGQLTNLRDLTNFKVGGVSSTGKQFGGELKDLKFLVDLRDELEITIGGNLANEKENIWEGAYLVHKRNLKVVSINLVSKESETNNEALIAKLQPNKELMKLWLDGYDATEISRWGRAHDDWAINLPNLVNIQLKNCRKLNGIPLLSNLKNLKVLLLYNLISLEYMEPSAVSRGSSGSKDLPFFPSLEFLSIKGLEMLKGWWGGVNEGDSSSGMPHWQPPFPRLSTLIIDTCPTLTSIPPCPSLELLQVTRSNKLLRILPGEGSANLDLKLRVEEIDSVGYLTTLPAYRLSHMKILRDLEVKKLSEVQEVFKSFSSLRSLEINWCTSLTSVSRVLEHLTALESLSLINIPGFVVDDPEYIPWRSPHRNLRSLTLESLDNLQILPSWMKHLAALQKLSIDVCISLKELPKWISSLSTLHTVEIYHCFDLKSLGTIQNIRSLQKLEILDCPYLTKACQEPRGKEWPKIRHIPHISIRQIPFTTGSNVGFVRHGWMPF
ncbi:putative disease resistance protein RGA1 isoform X2 [Silene latifolia]|uniref:putative disease resistance protein RGA1 isoform X2 n=1 Tax=Silene latifolia TaxID=37657 RepID=UPI003D78ACC3